MQKTVLIVEDDDEIGRLLVLLLSQETPYHVCLVHSAKEALWVVQEVKPALFLFDYYLPSMTVLPALRSTPCTAGVSCCSSNHYQCQSTGERVRKASYCWSSKTV